MASRVPSLYLWGDLLSESLPARALRRVLELLEGEIPLLEARHFWPPRGAALGEGRELPLSDGARHWTTRSLVSDESLQAIEAAVQGAAAAGSVVLAIAGRDEDPSAAIQASIADAGPILLIEADAILSGAVDAEALLTRVQQEARAAEKALWESASQMGIAVVMPVDSPELLAEKRALDALLEGTEELRLLDAADCRNPELEVVLHLCPPSSFVRSSGQARDVLRCSPGLGAPSHGELLAYHEADEIWVTHASQRRCLLDHGIPANRVRVLHEALDTAPKDAAPLQVPAAETQRLNALAELVEQALGAAGPWAFEAPFLRCARTGRRALLLPVSDHGWLRPWLDASLAGIPWIASDFGAFSSVLCDPSRGYPLPGRLLSQKDGSRRFEVDPQELLCAIRSWAEDPALAERKAKEARRHVIRRHSLPFVKQQLLALLAESRRREDQRGMVIPPAECIPTLRLEGSVFESSSYGRITRETTRALRKKGHWQVSLHARKEPSRDPDLDPDLHAELSLGLTPSDVCLRSGWPMRSDVPDARVYVQRVDWEYGALPKACAHHLAAWPDELWVHSSYVRDALLASGIPESRIWMLPHGVDRKLFESDTRTLPDVRGWIGARHAFLFVGAAIWRKGFDLLLRAYEHAFDRDDPVCLVLKLDASGSAYAGQEALESIEALRARGTAPEILVLDGELDEASLVALYRSCDTLVHPYRGEGFCMPVLEAAAAGMPIVTSKGGSTDDFLEECGTIKLTTRRVMARIAEPCVGPNSVLEPDIDELKDALRLAFTHHKGLAHEAQALQSQYLERYSWERVAERMDQRLRFLLDRARAEDAALRFESRERHAELRMAWAMD